MSEAGLVAAGGGSVLLLRAAALYVPMVAVAVAVWLRPPPPRRRGAALLATLYAWPPLLALNAAAPHLGWWRFGVEGASLLGTPVDLLLGWSLAWGALPLLAAPRARLPIVVLVALWLDLLLMPALEPVVMLGPRWLVGEAALLVAVLVPARLLGRWTDRESCLAGRAALQVVCFAGLVGFVLPSGVLAYTEGDGVVVGAALTAWRRAMRWGGVGGQLLLVPACLGLAAVREFVRRGGGTPVPFDPPARLVTTGPYAYLANPMQLSGTLAMLWMAAALASPWLAAGAVVAVAYSIGLAAWDEAGDLRGRFGPDWPAYRARVRNWIPRLRPASSPGPPARLYVDDACGPCSELGRWIEARDPLGLEIVPARLHPEVLHRMTWEPGGPGAAERGVAALAAAFQHLHLGWAACGWFMTLPGVRAFLQLVVDASGGDPHPARACATPPAEAASPSSTSF